MAELGSVALSTVEGARQQFQEQIEFLRRKLNLPSESWRDIQRAAHDRAFMVAGAAKADLLADLRKAVDQAVQGGSIGSSASSLPTSLQSAAGLAGRAKEAKLAKRGARG